MDIKAAVSGLSALAQQSRLSAFRLLVRAGDDGLAAGEIALALGVPNNTLSSHLAVLQHAGLIRSERQGRSIRYRVDLAAMRSLLDFIVEDCCHGHPEICAPAYRDCRPADTRA
jgi:ArsR family transcriptional regulator, arsenate/arsenite/antimonite-responsive transcriptional repressor